jgi:hypothetical protein
MDKEIGLKEGRERGEGRERKRERSKESQKDTRFLTEIYSLHLFISRNDPQAS